jgi:threonine/homoserine/homoserine lactone efflux protein
MGNPKVMVFYLALLPSILDLGRVTPAGYAGLVVVTLAVLTVVLGGYVALAGAPAACCAASARCVS